MTDLPARVIRYGVDEPLPERRSLRAGPLSVVLEEGTLRYVKLGDTEIVRGLYAAVRDKNWGTIEPRFTAYEVEEDEGSFRVRFTAEHRNDEVDFVWDGEIRGSENGLIEATMDGTARRDFLKNRIGFCVLHPMELAGTPVEVETPESNVTGAFPEQISPHQPFYDMVAIRHSAGPGAEAELRFEGDLFEMEDQRNWTDASYKTYCTPLRLGFPAEVGAGQRIAQSVTLAVSGAPGTGPDRTIDGATEVRVGAEPVGRLPHLGLSIASHGQPLGEGELEPLRTLRPAHLRADVDLTSPGWEGSLLRAADEAQALDAALELEVLSGASGEGLDDLAEAISRIRPILARTLVFPRSGITTTGAVLARARESLRMAGIETPIGGGSRAFFAEFNRAELPLDLMEVACYPVTPQVHAFDEASVVETLAAQATTVESARAIVGNLPLSVGPITLKMRFNPVATGPETESGEGELPSRVDPRQMSLFCAGWTIGSIRHLAFAGASSLTYYETTGWLGVMERADGATENEAFPSRPGMLFPVYHVFADLAEFADAELLPVEVEHPASVEALALCKDRRVLLLVANLTDEARSVTVRSPVSGEARVRMLDENTAEEALSESVSFRRRAAPEGSTDRIELDLFPFATVRVEIGG